MGELRTPDHHSRRSTPFWHSLDFAVASIASPSPGLLLCIICNGLLSRTTWSAPDRRTAAPSGLEQAIAAIAPSSIRRAGGLRAPAPMLPSLLDSFHPQQTQQRPKRRGWHRWSWKPRRRSPSLREPRSGARRMSRRRPIDPDALIHAGSMTEVRFSQQSRTGHLTSICSAPLRKRLIATSTG
jgi:hypothetical protein